MFDKPVSGVALLQNQFFIAEVKEPVELFAVAQFDHHVFGSERLLPEMTVRVLQVNLVQKLRFNIGDVIGLKIKPKGFLRQTVK